MPRTKHDGSSAQPWFRKAQALGTHDAKEGLRRPRIYPQVAEDLGIRAKLDPVAMGMLMSCYRAGFDLADL